MKTSGKKPGNPPTIIDVANEAGVSMKTVSRVINNEVRVKEKTRERVQSAIKRLGYQRNVFARGLRADRSLVLGLLYETSQGDYPADVLQGALSECRKKGYHLVVETLHGPNKRQQAARFLSQTRLDGVLMTPPVCDNASVLKAFKEFDTPYVRISPQKPRKNECYIGIDDFAAAKEVIDHLIGLGHRRIGFIKGLDGHRAAGERFSGYCSALEDIGIQRDDSLIVSGNFNFESGVEGAKTLLATEYPPTAIFAANDAAAAGVLSYAHSAGVSIPGDLSVCGFDGGAISRMIWPSLTTIHQPIFLLGESAVSLLIDNNEEVKKCNEPVILPHKLIISESTAPLRS
ncbi:MAG: LacI family DNA-binding transcriptional regulator [Maricaulaceae bacterium]